MQAIGIRHQGSLVELFESNCDNQGFVCGQSCLTNLLEVFEHWTLSMDEGYGVEQDCHRGGCCKTAGGSEAVV